MQRVIASVYFRECSATRPYIPMDRSCGYGSYPFHLDAAAPGKYTTLVVPDMLERVYVIEGIYNDVPVFADDVRGDGGGIAKDLVNEWGRNTLGPGGTAAPGIFVCAGTEPTAGELRAAIEGQLRLCEWKLLKAEDNWTKNKKNEVTEQDREAARWYLAQCEMDGRPVPPAFQNLEWVNVKPGEKLETVECPMCFTKIDARAAMCPNGHVVDFGKYQRYLANKAAIEQQLAASAQQSTSPEPPPLGKPVVSVVAENPLQPSAA